MAYLSDYVYSAVINGRICFNSAMRTLETFNEAPQDLSLFCSFHFNLLRHRLKHVLLQRRDFVEVNVFMSAASHTVIWITFLPL